MSARSALAFCCAGLFAAAALAKGAPAILVWQPLHTLSQSGVALRDDLTVLGEDVALSTQLFAYSADLSAHEIVMGVMGTTPDTHLLTQQEADALNAYVQAGGLLLLEGADVFNYDPDQQGGVDVRALFGLGPGSDGDGVFHGNLVGVGDFAGYAFDYFGELSFLDELTPVLSIPLLRKQDNDEVHAVHLPSYGAGSTIGISCEYAGLYDPAKAGGPTQRQALLAAFVALLRSASPVPAPHALAGARLHAAQPNPTQGTTTIHFELPRASNARLEVFDLRGRLVRVLESNGDGAGRFQARWDARDQAGRRVASGVYQISLRTGAERLWRKVVVLR